MEAVIASATAAASSVVVVVFLGGIGYLAAVRNRRK
jgi:hypothetical protein